MENAGVLGQVLLIIFLGLGCIILGFFLNRFLGGKRSQEAQKGASEIRELAKREAETIRKEADLQAKDLLIKMRQDFESQTKEGRPRDTIARARGAVTHDGERGFDRVGGADVPPDRSVTAPRNSP